MPTFNNLPSWFCLSLGDLSNGLALEFNGLHLPVNPPCLEDFPETYAEFVVPSAREWLTLPNGLNILTDLNLPWEGHPDRESPYPVIFDRSGNCSIIDMETSSWTSFEGVPPNTTDAEVKAQFNALLAQHGVSFQEYEALGGFVEIQQYPANHWGEGSPSSADLQLSYSPQVKAIQDGYWGEMGTELDTFDDLSDWQAVLECIVSFTGNYALLETVDVSVAQREYEDLLEEYMDS